MYLRIKKGCFETLRVGLDGGTFIWFYDMGDYFAFHHD